jgi:hypothetical protein
MRLSTLFFAAIAAIALISCASATKETAPKWVDGNPDYSANRYITGVGSGVSRDVAADRARNDLAKTISVSVESSERSKTALNANETFEKAFSSEVHTRVNQTVSGVEIAERYYDETNGVYYALAILDRAKSASNLNYELAGKDLAIDALIVEASKSDDALEKLKLLSQATELSDERRATAAVLAAISDQPLAPFNIDNDLLALKRAVTRSIKFSVGGDFEGKKLLSEALSAAGFVVADQTKSDYQAVGYLSQTAREENGLQWATAALEAEIVDYERGDKRNTFRLEAKDSSRNRETAKERAIAKLRNDLDKKLLAAIVSQGN